MALGQLVNGQWTKEWTERNESGQFQRMPTLFHSQITADGSSGFKAEPGRYHLYISLGCPWANRTALIWKLKGLEDVIGMSIVDPVISDQGWKFSDNPGCIEDTVNGADYLWQIYVKADSTYTGRVTVPVLWDKQTQTIVNNESRQIIRMLNSEFNVFAKSDVDFYPIDLRETIDKTIDDIYQPINNGVYRSGFAASQSAYEEAVTELFAALERWETVLSEQRYLCGDQITLADWCLFTTLFRFDLAYYGLFKCNLKRIVDYPNLWNYLLDLYQQPGVREVCSADHVKQLYYGGLPELNPSRIVPIGPAIDFEQSHDRNRLSSAQRSSVDRVHATA
ncbi:glutathione S-transferase family protein [Leptolyngbya ohadii]|uniref:glutathione S-transferase family protein n=1 Tax=Leptolyngbya ohadii TaxID=1962290 RepID=UPI000B59D774|nr:glutathione S-transferase family protein [Leptolyngbya ohadii]